MKDENNFRGVFQPLPTPFLDDGKVDYPVLEELVEFYISAGVNAFYVMGSSGQGPAMAVEQRKKVAEAVMKKTGHRIPVTIYIGAVDPYTSIELGKHARSLETEAVTIVGPYYYSDRSEWEIIEQIKMIDRAVELPVFIYNNPQYSGYDMSPSMIAKLCAEMPRIIGMKLAGGTIPLALRHHRTVPELSLFIPADSLFPALLLGIKGTVSPPLMPFPGLGVDVVRAIDRGDLVAATQAQLRFFEYQNMRASVSAGRGGDTLLEFLRLRGIQIKHHRRWPTKPLTPEAKEQIRKVFETFAGPINR